VEISDSDLAAEMEWMDGRDEFINYFKNKKHIID
jgi:hypothetical protein